MREWQTGNVTAEATVLASGVVVVVVANLEAGHTDVYDVYPNRGASLIDVLVAGGSGGRQLAGPSVRAKRYSVAELEDLGQGHANLAGIVEGVVRELRGAGHGGVPPKDVMPD